MSTRRAANKRPPNPDVHAVPAARKRARVHIPYSLDPTFTVDLSPSTVVGARSPDGSGSLSTVWQIPGNSSPSTALVASSISRFPIASTSESRAGDGADDTMTTSDVTMSDVAVPTVVCGGEVPMAEVPDVTDVDELGAIVVDNSGTGLLFSELPISLLSEDSLRIVLRAHRVPHSGPKRNGRYRDLALRHVCSPFCENVRFSIVDSEPGSLSDTSDAAWDHYLRLVGRKSPAQFPPDQPPQHERPYVRQWLSEEDNPTYNQVVCASCGRKMDLPETEIRTVSQRHLAVLVNPSLPTDIFPRGYDRNVVCDALLDTDGIVSLQPTCELRLCAPCWSRLRIYRMPSRALANLTYTGWDNVPDDIRMLFVEASILELSLIARYRARCTVFKFSRKRSSPEYGKPPITSQAYTKGNVITFVNGNLNLLNRLPPSPDEVNETISVIFVGSVLPPPEELERCTPLLVRRPVVVPLLTWLKDKHPLYTDAEISHENLDALLPNRDSGLPVGLQIQLVTAKGTESAGDPTVPVEDVDIPGLADVPIATSGIIGRSIADMTVQEMKMMSMSSWRRGGTSFAIPHADKPLPEWHNPDLFCGAFPHLFPFGIGGLDNPETGLSLEDHTQLLLNRKCQRFATDHSFMYFSANIVLRRRINSATSFRVNRSDYVAADDFFASVDPAVLSTLQERAKNNKGFVRGETDEELSAMRFVNRLRHIPVSMPGTPAAKKSMRNEIRSTSYLKGVPAVFITINPPDLHHPLFLKLAGLDIDLSQHLPANLPGDFERKRLLAQNPTAAAKFFDAMIERFLAIVVGMANGGNGLFGKVDAYYGTVESQQRGSLHFHVLLWISGALAPQALRDRMECDSEYKKRLFDYLESLISTSMPKDRGVVRPSEAKFVKRPKGEPHPSTLRCPHPDQPDFEQKWDTQLERLTYDSHFHKHNDGCYKNLKPDQSPYLPDGSYNPALCRMRMNGETRATTVVDPETGSILLRRWHPDINQHNRILTMLTRGNNDVKFIGSGEGAKALTYYVTDYVTKDALPMEEIYTALVKCVERVRDPRYKDPSFVVGRADDNRSLEMGRKLLRRACNSLLASREISAQEVAMFFEKRTSPSDHYTNMSYAVLIWGNFWRWAENSEEAAAQPDSGPVDHELTFDEDDVRRGFQPSSQLEDYRWRGRALQNAPLYWFVASTVRVTASRESVRESSSRTSSSRTTPRVPFLPEHPRYGQQILRMRETLACPTIVGPTLPRYDFPDQNENYCKAMLLLFKPWRKYEDLRGDAETWRSAFENFAFDEHSVAVMRHLNEWYECKDASDTYRDLRNRGVIPHDLASAEVMNHVIDSTRVRGSADVYDWINEHHPALEGLLTAPVDEYGDVDTVDDAVPGKEILVEKKKAERCEKAKKLVEDLIAAAGSDYLSVKLQPGCQGVTDKAQEGATMSEQMLRWRAETDAIRRRLKSRSRVADALDSDSDEADILQSIFETVPSGEEGGEPCAREVCTAMADDSHPDRGPNLVRSIIKKHKYNPQQEAAFGLIAEHKLLDKPEQLLQFVAGGAGTGKSYIVGGLDELFDALGISEELEKSAYTGAAAHLLGTETLHYMLDIWIDDVSGPRLEKLQNRWRQVKYLVLDEVSMIGARFLAQISTRLQLIMGDPRSFGGINVIFFGDPRQLPPIGDPAVWSTPAHIEKITTKRQLAVAGVSLWSEVESTVVLTQNYRQSQDTQYQALLERIGDGKGTHRDCEMLRKRLLGKVKVTPEFYDVPLITTDKTIRDEWNIQAVRRFAARTGQMYAEYVALDKCDGKLVSPLYRDTLLHMSSSYTRDRMGYLPLVEGMPVMVIQNVITPAGVVNGAEGILVKVFYDSLPNGERNATCALVKVRGCNVKYEGLEPGIIPIQPVASKPFSVRLRDQTTIRVVRWQLPLLPGSAITDYKSQGQGIQYAYLDPASATRKRESAYVMVTRIVKLENLIIIRDFPDKIFTRPLSDETRALFQQLRNRSAATELRWRDSYLRAYINQLPDE